MEDSIRYLGLDSRFPGFKRARWEDKGFVCRTRRRVIAQRYRYHHDRSLLLGIRRTTGVAPPGRFEPTPWYNSRPGERGQRWNTGVDVCATRFRYRRYSEPLTRNRGGGDGDGGGGSTMAGARRPPQHPHRRRENCAPRDRVNPAAAARVARVYGCV